MTALLVVALALMAAAVVGAFIVPAVRWFRCWTRLWNLAVSFQYFDSGRQATRASHTGGGHRTAPPERGSIWPSLRTRGGLPACYRIVGRINQHGRDDQGFLAEVAHHTGREWTLERSRLSRVLVLRQAPPPLAAVPMPRVDVAAIGWWYQFPIGTSRTGPVWWNPADDETANLLVVARTGWGKSHLATNLLDHADAAPDGNWLVYVIDPEEALPTANHAAVGDTGVTPDDQLAVLGQVDVLFTHRPVGAATSRVLVLIDEFPAVMEAPTRAATDYEARRQVIALIEKFLKRGRKRGIHVVAFAQDPRAKVIGGAVRSAFGARLAGWLDIAEVPLALRRPVPRLLTGQGHGWWCAKEADPVEIQTYDRAGRQQHAHARPDPAREEAPTTTTAYRIFGAISARRGR